MDQYAYEEFGQIVVANENFSDFRILTPNTWSVDDPQWINVTHIAFHAHNSEGMSMLFM